MAEIISGQTFVACGFCQEPLGNLSHLMEAPSIEHACLIDYDDLELDLERKVLLGKGRKDLKKSVINSASAECTSEIANARVTNVSSKVTVASTSTGTNVENVTKTNVQSTQESFVRPSAGDKWSNEETKLLITLFKENEKKFKSPQYNKKQVWNIISEKLKEYNVIKEGSKCDEKWRNLKKTYDKILQDKNLTGNSNSYWRFFNDMHELFFKDPHFSPVCTVSSTGLIKKRKQEKVEDIEDISSPDDAGAGPSNSKKKKELNVFEERRQKRHDEKMSLKREMFTWFKEHYEPK